MHVRGMHIWLLLSVVCLLVAGVPTVPRVQAQADLVLEVTPAFAGNYRPFAWLPLYVALENDRDSFEATVAVQIPNGSGRVSLAVDLPRGARKEVVLYVPMQTNTRELTLTVEHDDRAVANQQIAVRPRIEERLLGIVSTAPPTLNLPRRQDMQAFPFVRFELLPERLPDQAAGLSSVNLLLLHDLAGAQLDAAQQRALAGWVANGGHLLIAGGASNRTTLAALPEALRPAVVGATRELDPSPLADFVQGDGPDALSGTALQPVEGAASFGPQQAPLWVWRSFGEGRITMLAFDPGLAELRTWNDAPAFWDRLLQPAQCAPALAGLASEPTFDSWREHAMARAAGDVPESDIPTGTSLFGLLTVYILTAGPLLALVLRRTDRRTWAWLLLPLLAVGFGMAGFGLALASRSNQQIISQVSLVSQVTKEQAHVRTVLGMLAPGDETVTVHMPPGALTRPVRPSDTPVGLIAAAQANFVQQSDHMQIQLARWKFSGLLAEQQVKYTAPEARLRFDASGPRIEVDNLTDQPLYNVVAMYGSQIVSLGDIAPDEQATQMWPAAALLPNGAATGAQLVNQVQAAMRVDPGTAQATLVDAALANQGQPVTAAPLLLALLDESPLPLQVAAHNATTQQTTLLMLQPRIEASGSLGIPAAWLTLDLSDPLASQGTRCTAGGAITGLLPNSLPATLVLRLPADLADLQATSLTLTVFGLDTSAEAEVNLYNWQQDSWEPVEGEATENLIVSEPAAYMQQGRLPVRLSGNSESGVCVGVAARLTGEMP